MTEFTKELNNFLINDMGLKPNCDKYTIEYSYFKNQPNRPFIGGFNQKLSIDKLIKIENFLKEKLNIEVIYIDMCEIDNGYSISWEV